MAPAFSSPRQAGAFAVLLLATLVSPILIGKWALPPREQVYSSISWNSGDFPFIHEQIFEQKGDIDIAFIGASGMYHDIDTPYVQKKLSEKLGRQATVLSLCWRWAGIDLDYFVAQDLLQHRKVHMLVFYDDQGADKPHVHAWQLVRIPDNWKDLEGLPLQQRLAYYYGAVLGMPRNLFSLVRPPLPPYLTPKTILFLQWDGICGPALRPPTENLGAEQDRTSWGGTPFVPYAPQTGAAPSEAIIYSAATKNQFEFSGPPVAPLQRYFARKLVTLAETCETKLTCLHMPVFNERWNPTIPQGQLWPDTLRGYAELVGIPPLKLFAGLDTNSMHQLFVDPVHLNENGQIYFTRLITPSLIQIYEARNN